MPGWLVALFAVAAGTAVANVYLAHPLLVTLGREFGLAPAVVGGVVTAVQVGYGLGLVLMVPLGDLVDPRRLALILLLVLAAALGVVGVAGTPVLLFAGMAAVGLTAVVTQVLVASAAALAGPDRRGRVVGAVTSGVVVGILLARAVSGVLADLAGWRSVYFAAAAVILAVTLMLARTFPRLDAARARGTYAELLRSMVELFVRERVFRVRALLAMLVFAAFSTLWSSVALPLTAAGLSHAAIGAFGLAGAAGAAAAWPAGRWNDRGFAQRTTGVGLALLTVSWLPLGFTGQSLWALAAGAVLLDLAVQAVHVTNQSLIYELRPAAGSRLIAGYMVFYSIGSGAGAVAATAAYSLAGWIGVCLLGATFSLAALLLWALFGGHQPPLPRQHPETAARLTVSCSDSQLL